MRASSARTRALSPAARAPEQRVVRRVHACEQLALPIGIIRPDARGALEQEVLQEVRDAGGAEPLVHASHGELHHERDRGCALAIEDQEAHAVFERELPNRKTLARRLRLLRGERLERGRRDSRARRP
jgi:hypothetical protein